MDNKYANFYFGNECCEYMDDTPSDEVAYNGAEWVPWCGGYIPGGKDGRWMWIEKGNAYPGCCGWPNSVGMCEQCPRPGPKEDWVATDCWYELWPRGPAAEAMVEVTWGWLCKGCCWAICTFFLLVVLSLDSLIDILDAFTLTAADVGCLISPRSKMYRKSQNHNLFEVDIE